MFTFRNTVHITQVFPNKWFINRCWSTAQYMLVYKYYNHFTTVAKIFILKLVIFFIFHSFQQLNILYWTLLFSFPFCLLWHLIKWRNEQWCTENGVFGSFSALLRNVNVFILQSPCIWKMDMSDKVLYIPLSIIFKYDDIWVIMSTFQF